MKFSGKGTLGLLSLTAIILTVFLLAPVQAASKKPYVRIVNSTGIRLHVYGAGLTEVAQIAPGQEKVLKLPVRFHYQGSYHNTRQFVVTGGGSWTADSSGWTTYRNAKVCTDYQFRHTSGGKKWTIRGGKKKSCGPRGYRQ